MSGATVADFVVYWEGEGASYAKRGDYEWMASLIPAGKVLEIGCGVGFGTAALAGRDLDVLAIDNLPECLAAARARLATQAGARVEFLEADLAALTPESEARLAAFAPQTIVCWLMGAPAETTGAVASDAGQAVAAYREKLHRLTAELAARLPSVHTLHFVDRTAIPWQAKDIGRDTLVRYHLGKTLLDLPFTAERKDALYRKLEGNVVDLAEVRRSHPALKSVVPTLASLITRKKV